MIATAAKKIGFTQTVVDKMKAPAGKADATIWDKNMNGFGVRFRGGGTGVYTIKYSLNGRQAKIALGRVDQVTLEDAQVQAKQHFAEIARKEDPHLNRAKKLEQAGDSFAAKIDMFLEWLRSEGRTPDYIDAVRHSLAVLFSDLHRYGVGDITRKMVAKELDRIATKYRRRAGTARAHLSSYYAYLMLKGYDGFNPVAGTETRNSEARNRVLTPDELRLIWKATASGSAFDTIVRLLVLTASRKTAISWLRKEEYNPELHIIDVPVEPGKSKNGERFWMALNPQAEEIVKKAVARHRGASPFVFGFGKGGFDSGNKAKDRLDARIAELNGGKPIPHWVLHDLRRTFNSLGIDKCGIDDADADRCLFHVGEHKKGIKRTYNHAQYLDKKHAAMAAWGAYIAKLTRHLHAVA
jgi:integrase